MSTLGLVLLVILILILLGGIGGPYLGGLPYGYGAGHYGVGGIGLILIILVILVVAGRI